MAKLEESVNSAYLKNFEYLLSNLKALDAKPTILIVDDERDNLQLLKRTLRSSYKILEASDGNEALDVVNQHGDEIALIISDQRMPKMTGTEFLSTTMEKYPKIVKMLLTGYSDIETLIDSVNKCELFQYILKPFEPEELQIIVKNGMKIYELSNNKEAILNELKELFFTTIKSISSALDAKDTYTHGHSMRVTLYSLILSKEMGFEEKFLEDIETTGLLHDIGKIGVPESILCKPGKLTDDEYAIMKMHPEQGKKILDGIEKLKSVSLWLNCHHERWDGRGYPQGLKEKEIPIVARILSISDTYDAMTSDRSYRKGLPHEVALEEITRCSGSQFDPELVQAFLRVENLFKEAMINPEELYEKYSVLNKIYLKD